MGGVNIDWGKIAPLVKKDPNLDPNIKAMMEKMPYTGQGAGMADQTILPYSGQGVSMADMTPLSNSPSPYGSNPQKMPIKYVKPENSKGPAPITAQHPAIADILRGAGTGAGAQTTTGFTAPTDQTANINTQFDTLEQTVRDEFGNLQTTDFTAQIQDLIEQGRLSLQDLNAQQLASLQEAALRREGQIGDIQTGLEGDLALQEQYRQDIQQQVADQAAQRAGQMTSDQAARIQAAREGLGPQVTSEFEEVAALTGGLTGSQALSTTAGMDRLAQVANQGAAQRLAAPAMLAAEAKMAVGDEKFRLENQLQQQLAEGLAELNMQEQQQVLQEAMRQEQFGIERDQAMANALMNIASQRTGATLGEAQRLEDVAIRQGEILQGQGFQSAEAQKQRDFQASQAAASRAAAAKQAELDRAFSKERFDESVRQFNIQAGLSAADAEESARQFEIIQGFKEDQFNWEKMMAEGEALAANAPPETALGWLSENFEGVDDGLKMIAFAGATSNPEIFQNELNGMMYDRNSNPKGITPQDRKNIETMVDQLVPVIAGEANLPQGMYENFLNTETDDPMGTIDDFLTAQGSRNQSTQDYLDYLATQGQLVGGVPQRVDRVQRPRGR